jgi:choline dehydrogenase-like flavoprotein
MTTRYDVIIIGSGAGGGTLAYALSQSGKKILVLERGGFLPREKENWDTIEVFHHDRYHTKEVWRDRKGAPIHPGTGYWVGGNTKVYGAALFRLRERDFEEVIHKGGISPAWPIRYLDLAPYYARAEELYTVHGKRGEDTAEPERGEYPHPPVSHEPRIAEVAQLLSGKGLHPFHCPLGIKLDEAHAAFSTCIRCNTCDGFPCLVNAKSDADVNCIRPALATGNVTLLTDARVLRLESSGSGREVTGVVAQVGGEPTRFVGDIVVVSCGAINSAALLLASTSDRHPRGLANSSDLVGRNFMRHNNAALIGVTKQLNPTTFQKTLALNDFYWGEKDFPYPMGHVQMLGKSTADMLKLDAPGITPADVLDRMAKHAVDWWITGEDLPDRENRVHLEDGNIFLDYVDNNQESYDRLLKRWTHVLKSIDCADHVIPCGFYMRKKIPLQGVAHQVGTCRFGHDPKTSVLDATCRAHDLDNLYVVDGSFFPSSGAVNPALTIAANALRVGDHLLERLR